MKIKNTSPFGDLVVPSLGIEVKAGATVDVEADVAEALLSQPFHWSAADKAANAITQPAVEPANDEE